MTKRLLGVAVTAVMMIGIAGVSVSATAQSTREDTPRLAEPGSSGGVARGERSGSGVDAPNRVETRSGSARPPSLGDPNRGMSGFYRNRIGMTPPSARRGSGRSSIGRGGGGRR